VAVSTTPNAIDRKLHRVVLDADPEQFKSFAALARQISMNKPQEFSYQRFGKTEYAGADAIEAYVSFAHDIGLLDGDLKPARQKKEIRALENFQQWLGDLTLQYLESKNASLKQIEEIMENLMHSSPCRLSTQENIRAQIQNPPSSRNFRLCLKVVALLRSDAIRLASRRLVLVDGIVEG
jgi:hypothetical protein